MLPTVNINPFKVWGEGLWKLRCKNKNLSYFQIVEHLFMYADAEAEITEFNCRMRQTFLFMNIHGMWKDRVLVMFVKSLVLDTYVSLHNVHLISLAAVNCTFDSIDFKNVYIDP